VLLTRAGGIPNSFTADSGQKCNEQEQFL